MLELDEISVSRGTRSVLTLVSLRLNAGEVLMVGGANGAGKSTLLQACAGSLALSSGLVTLADPTSGHKRSLTDYSNHELARRRAVLTQNIQLAFPFTVREILGLGLVPWSLRPKEIEHQVVQMAHQLELLRLLDHPCHCLSGGQLQRVQLGRILLQLTGDDSQSLIGRVLLLDEPLAALDLQYQQLVLRLMRALAARGAAIFCVIHDLNLASLYGDRMLLLDHGKIVALGQPEEVMQTGLIEQLFASDGRMIIHPDHGLPQWLLAR